MSNSILTQEEITCVKHLISFLRNHGVNRLADRVERVFNHALDGAINRKQFFTSCAVKDSVFRAVIFASREQSLYVVREFVNFLAGSTNGNSYDPEK